MRVMPEIAIDAFPIPTRTTTTIFSKTRVPSTSKFCCETKLLPLLQQLVSPSRTISARRSTKSASFFGTPKKSTALQLSSYPSSSSLDDDASALENQIDDGNSTNNDDFNNSNNSLTNLLSLLSYTRLALFTLTVCGNWFAEPIQSLIDTVVVGRVSTIHLAALGPATIVFDAACYLTYFLAIATTNLLGVAIAQNDQKKQRQVTSQSLGMGLVLGILITIVLSLDPLGGRIIRWMIMGASTTTTATTTTTTSSGSTTAAAAVSSLHQVDKKLLSLTSSAMAYVRIRSLTAPASIVTMVAQAACLAHLDTVTPTLAVVVASLLNVLGDLVFCLKCSFGICGAAAATALAQVASCVILLQATWKRFNHRHNDDDGVDDSSQQQKQKNENNDNSFKEENLSPSTTPPDSLEKDEVRKTEKTGKTTSVYNNETTTAGIRTSWSPTTTMTTATTTTMATTTTASVPFVSLPGRSDFWKMCSLGGPIFFVIFGEICCQMMLTFRAGICAGHNARVAVLSLASHNILLRIYLFFATFGDGLSHAAQAYFPRLYYHHFPNSNNDDDAVNDTSNSALVNANSTQNEENDENNILLPLQSPKVNNEENENESTPVLTSMSRARNDPIANNSALFVNMNGKRIEKEMHLQVKKHKDQSSVGEKQLTMMIRTLWKRLFVLGGITAIFCSSITFVLTNYMGSIFTANAELVSVIKTVSPWLACIFWLQPLNLLWEGAAIARRDFTFLLSNYVSCLALLELQMNLFCRRGSSSLASVWKAFFGFQVVRFAQFVGRELWKTKKREGKTKSY